MPVMPLLNDIVQWIGSMAVQQTILSLVLVSSLIVAIEERRISVMAFLAQYALLALLLAGRIYQPVATLKGLIGLPIALILLISAGHLETQLRKQPGLTRDRTPQASAEWRRALSQRLHRVRTPPALDAVIEAGDFPQEGPVLADMPFRGMGLSFRLLVVTLGAAGAYGLWQAYPIDLLPPQIGLACYWLVTTGLLLAATSQDPLRVGMGLLTLFNGFQIAYYSLNTSLMLVGLIGTAEILIALASANAAERWGVGLAKPEGE